MGHCLITGGSSGIGLAIARLVLGMGDVVTLVARDMARLEDAKAQLISKGITAERIHLAAADVADHGVLQEAINASERAFGAPNTVIASAGVVMPGLFGQQRATDFDRQIAVNLTGVANTVRLVLPSMMNAQSGRILIISSGAGLVSIPGYSAYCASKAALRAFASALRLETQPYGISVSACFPPDTQTPQLAQELSERPPEARLFMGAHKAWDVESVAERAFWGMQKGRCEIHFGFSLTALAYLEPLIRPFLHRIYAFKLPKR